MRISDRIYSRLSWRNHHNLETLQRERGLDIEDKDFNFLKEHGQTASLCLQEKYHSPASFKEEGFSFLCLFNIVDHPNTKPTKRTM